MRIASSQGRSGEAHFFQPRLAAFPAQLGNHATGGHHGIGNTVLQIDLAVAVAIHTTFQIILRQKLHHADFASPCAGGRRIDDALIEQLEKGDELRAEEIRAAAVIGKGDERIQRVEIALNGAVVRLQPQKAARIGPGTP